MSVRPKRVRDSDSKGRPTVDKPPAVRLPPKKKRRRKSKKQEEKTDEDPPEEKMDRLG